MKPTVPDVLQLVRKLYRTPRGGVGCCLHGVLDDGNLDDGNIEFGLELATARQHPDCLELCRLLLQMSETQRRKLYSNRHSDPYS